MKHSNILLLAINDGIIALDVEDVIQNHFDCSVTTLTILEAIKQIDFINPDLIIVDCDVNYENVCVLLQKIDSMGLGKICFCTSKQQASTLERDKTEVLLKPFDNDELIAAISRISPLKANLQQTK